MDLAQRISQRVIELVRTPQQFCLSSVKATVGKSRNARTGDKLTYAWNINMGILRYMPTEHDARKGRGAEELLEEYGDADKSDSVF